MAAQIIIVGEMNGPMNIDGTEYFQLACTCMSADFAPSGVLSKLTKWIDRAIPDLDIMEYMPKKIKQGEGLPGWNPGQSSWVAPYDLYLMSAKLQGGLGFDFLEKYIITVVDCWYTGIPPDEFGNIFVPEGGISPPGEETHIEIERADGWSGWVPVTYGEIPLVWAKMLTYSIDTLYFLPSVLWLCNGAVITSEGHFLHESKFPLAHETSYVSQYLGQSYGWYNEPGMPSFSAFNVGMANFNPPLRCQYNQYSYGDNREWVVFANIGNHPGFYIPTEKRLNPGGLSAPLGGFMSRKDKLLDRKPGGGIESIFVGRNLALKLDGNLQTLEGYQITGR